MVQAKQALTPLVGVTGVALAGGRASRMGSDKAALLLAGRPLIAHVVERMRRALASVIVIGPASLAALQPDAPVIPDAQPGLGPLGGLATALEAARADWIFLVACDMPFIQPALVRHMAALALAAPDAEAVAIRAPGGLEPLHAAYRRDIAPQVARALTSPRPSMRGLLEGLRVIEVAPEDIASLDPRHLSTFNANTPDDWRRALQLAADGVNDEGVS
jgi:molybdopterin-guanine dinucleotide biosynthesis protein A